MTYQQVIIVGNVGRKPELRYTPTGIAVTDFSLAVTRSWNNESGEAQERTTWWKVTCWRRQAEVVAEYVTKGKQVMVVATQVEADAYTAKNGDVRASLTVTADEVRFLQGGNSGGGNGRPADETPADGTDIPF